MLEPRHETVVAIPIEAPDARAMRDNERVYTVEYELRYSFKTMTIGRPFKFSIKVRRPYLGISSNSSRGVISKGSRFQKQLV